MPGYVTHRFVQRRIADEGANAPGPLGEVCRLMTDQARIAAMGSIGPDLTFFLDLMPEAQLWLQRAKGIYEAIESFCRPFSEAVESLGNTLDGLGASNVPGYDPAKAAFAEFEKTFDALSGTFLTWLGTMASGYVDILGYGKLAMQWGHREEKWCWFDMVHYRRTSQFARNLYLRAGDDDQMRAFAAGYATHLATDTAGHAFVNACAGGPFRTQLQRHHCTDNYIDVWTLAHYEGRDINESRWQTKYPPRMGGKFRRQLVDALKDTYAGIRHPDGELLDGREWPNLDDVDRMYEMLMEMITVQTNGYTVPEPKPPECPVDFDSFPSPPSYEDIGGGGRRRGGFSWKALWDALVDFVKETLGYVRDVLDWIGDTLVATSLYPFMWALYLIQLALYNIYRALRRVLALRGYIFGHPDELVGGSAVSSGLAGTIAGATLVGVDDLEYDLEKTFYIPEHRHESSYPHQEGAVTSPKLLRDATDAMAKSDPETKLLIQACLALGGFPQAFQMPWRYPTTALESVNARNSPYEDGSLPDVFIEQAGFQPEFYEALQNCTSAGQMVSISKAASESQTQCLGNAVDLGLAILKDTVESGGAPDFNLDGDRGYGWLCWDVEPLGASTRPTDAFAPADVVIGPDVGRA